MTQFEQICSKENKLIKYTVKLANDQKWRELEQQAVIYGEHLLIEALKYNLVSDILILDAALSHYLPLLPAALLAKTKLLSAEVMAKVNILDSRVEIVALINLPICNLAASKFNQDCLLLEQIQDPGNLGTILRAAKASGIQQVFLSSLSVDIYNPKVLRASQGLQFGLQVYTEVNLADFICAYPGQVLAMVPRATASLYHQDLRQTTALVLGNEGQGLSPELLSLIPRQIKIPMAGDAESLNLAMAATIGMFEMSRQRIMLKDRIS